MSMILYIMYERSYPSNNVIIFFTYSDEGQFIWEDVYTVGNNFAGVCDFLMINVKSSSRNDSHGIVIALEAFCCHDEFVDCDARL